MVILASTVPVKIPAAMASMDEARLLAYFERLVATDLSACIDREVWEFDDRAGFYRIDVLRVELDSDMVGVFYVVFFDAYYCWLVGQI